MFKIDILTWSHINWWRSKLLWAIVFPLPSKNNFQSLEMNNVRNFMLINWMSWKGRLANRLIFQTWNSITSPYESKWDRSIYTTCIVFVLFSGQPVEVHWLRERGGAPDGTRAAGRREGRDRVLAGRRLWHWRVQNCQTFVSVCLYA